MSSFAYFFTQGCQVVMSITTNALQCSCTHLSAFAGSIFVMPGEINLSQDLLLFTKFFNNPVIATVTFAVVFGYLLLLYVAYQKDNRDFERVIINMNIEQCRVHCIL